MRSVLEVCVVGLVLWVVIWMAGRVERGEAKPRTCLQIDRVLLDGHVATWWIEQAEGSSVAVIRVQTRP